MLLAPLARYLLLYYGNGTHGGDVTRHPLMLQFGVSCKIPTARTSQHQKLMDVGWPGIDRHLTLG